MDMIKKRYIMISFVIIISLATIIASSISFRFYPSHMIVRQVNCISCHIDEFEDLKIGIHIRPMDLTQNKTMYDYIDLYGNVSGPAYKNLIEPCYTCHVAYTNFNLFGLTDPYLYSIGNYVYNIGNMAVSETVTNAQYGYIINWPIGNMATEYLDESTTNVTVELEVLDIEPTNVSVDSTIKILFSNYSGQQSGSTTCDCYQPLYKGETQVVIVENVKNDYFNIILLLEGIWNNATLKLDVIGTDKGTESFTINVDHPPVIYNIPTDTSGISYFKTNGTYKAERLDIIWTKWRESYVNGNITSSETVQVSTLNGWVDANTCSSPGGMCHINQKVTYMGMSNGMNPNRSFYPHRMEFVTSKQCKICHLK